MYSEHLDLTTLNELLVTKRIGRTSIPNEIWNEIDSTNTRALELAADGAPHGLVVAARQQTAGRGRQGKTWVSPLDAGLYISFLLRPQVELTQIPLISLATGAAVARALRSACGIQVGLKWVNDIVYDGKKLGGILAEMPNRNTLVVGIGINLRDLHEQMPDELKGRSVSVEEIVGSPVSANQVAANLMLELEHAYSLLEAGEKTQIVELWKVHAVTLGKVIRAHVGNEVIEGLAKDIAVDGSLILETLAGDRRLHAGEISIRLKDGSYA